MDRPVDSPAAQQGAVGRIDDRIDCKRRDVADHDFEPRGTDIGRDQRRCSWVTLGRHPFKPSRHHSDALRIVAAPIAKRIIPGGCRGQH